MGISLAGCNNGTQTSDASLEQKSAIQKTDLQVVGSIKGTDGIPTWNVAAPVDAQIFKMVTTESYALTIKLAVDDEFKFAFDRSWTGALGYGGVDWTASAAVKDAFKNAGTDDGGNIKVLTAGTYKFVYDVIYVLHGVKPLTITAA
jgi:hypothetical protein